MIILRPEYQGIFVVFFCFVFLLSISPIASQRAVVTDDFIKVLIGARADGRGMSLFLEGEGDTAVSTDAAQAAKDKRKEALKEEWKAFDLIRKDWVAALEAFLHETIDMGTYDSDPKVDAQVKTRLKQSVQTYISKTTTFFDNLADLLLADAEAEDTAKPKCEIKEPYTFQQTSGAVPYFGQVLGCMLAIAGILFV